MVSIVRVKNLDEGLKLIENSEYGNAACLYTTNGKTAREFKYRAVASMMGINLGIAAPMSFFPLVDLQKIFLRRHQRPRERGPPVLYGHEGRHSAMDVVIFMLTVQERERQR